MVVRRLVMYVVRRFGDVGGEQVLRRTPHERRLTREELVREHAERIDVGAVVHGGIGARLLGRHVRGGTQSHPHRRHRASVAIARRAERLGHTEVGDHRAPARQQDVVRLDVAVHDAALVRVGERARHLAQEAHGLAEREFPLAHQSCAERLAAHEGHREIRQSFRVTGGEERHDVRMLEPCRQRDLAFEAFHAHLPRHLGGGTFTTTSRVSAISVAT
jgi:hypothetical protein